MKKFVTSMMLAVLIVAFGSMQTVDAESGKGAAISVDGNPCIDAQILIKLAISAAEHLNQGSNEESTQTVVKILIELLKIYPDPPPWKCYLFL